ncbi:hypothetical protein SAMN05216262_1122 [Colwellia chukchiensis]|uniref:Uncharacterized protein n=1 Tax=Colwellia chukchiensis TaxID=641665 RepID=A0A1H7QK74_9GAMM|nr:hypothetical protein [Colwellia chukchiensis]SEL48189.1 hypothetical protein SAMN05216262_1122 [Colwellia chukchiensis]
MEKVKNNKLGFTISIFFLFGMLLKESVLFPIVAFFILNDFYASQVSYVLFALIVSYLLFKYVILPNNPFKAVISVEGVNAYNTAIAIIIGIFSIALAFSLWGTQVFVVAQFSERAFRILCQPKLLNI